MKVCILGKPTQIIEGGKYFYDLVIKKLTQRGAQITTSGVPNTYDSNIIYRESRRQNLQALNEFKPDIIILYPDAFYNKGRFVRELKNKLKIPIVAVINGIWGQNKILNSSFDFKLFFLNRQLRRFDGFIIDNECSETEKMMKLLGDKPRVMGAIGKDRHIEKGLREIDIEERTQDSTELRLLYRGPIVNSNGLLDLLESLDLISGIPWVLNVVGDLKADRKYTYKIFRWLGTRAWSPRVQFIGTPDDKVQKELLFKSHLTVSAPHSTIIKLPVLEGFGYGVPALASSSSGTSSTIVHGENGYIFKPRLPGEFAAAIERIHKDRSLLSKLSKNALQAFQSAKGWEENVLATVGFIEKMAK